jgi:hypothetical protein
VSETIFFGLLLLAYGIAIAVLGIHLAIDYHDKSRRRSELYLRNIFFVLAFIVSVLFDSILVGGVCFLLFALLASRITANILR